MIAKTPPPPYYAVIFSSLQTQHVNGYKTMARDMIHLAQEQSGFLGVEHARSDLGITVSYWENIEAIKMWKENTQHLMAQSLGKTTWYSHYKVRICKIDQDYGFEK